MATEQFIAPLPVNGLSQKSASLIKTWLTRQISGEHYYVFLDGISLPCFWNDDVKSVRILVAIGIDSNGYREVLGVEDADEKTPWMNFLFHLCERGLKGVKLFVAEKDLDLVESIARFYPHSRYQHCTTHFYRKVCSLAPAMRVRPVAGMLKAIHASDDLASARAATGRVLIRLRDLKLGASAALIAEQIEETFSYYAFPPDHWRWLQTNNSLDRLNRDIRRRTSAMSTFPESDTMTVLVAAHLRRLASTRWRHNRFLDMSGFRQSEKAPVLLSS